MSTTEYCDYAKDRTGWFFGLSGAQLSVVILTGAPWLAALDGHRWLGYLPIWWRCRCAGGQPPSG